MPTLNDPVFLPSFLGVVVQVGSTELPQAVGFCLDTCHLYAAGYNIATADGLSAVTKQIESVLGFGNVPVIHTNDSKGALGSHLDRHAHIGQGQIGEDGFARILRHPKWKKCAFVLETPEDESGDHRKNLEVLRRLAAKSGGS